MNRAGFHQGVCLIAVLAIAGCQLPPPVPPASPLPPDVMPCTLPPPQVPRMMPKPEGTAWFAPAPPFYPYPDDSRLIVQQAQCLSSALDTYIRAWMDGRVGPEIPDAFIPAGIDRSQFRSFRLVRPQDIDAREQWGVRPATPIDFGHLSHSFPDPNVTYLLLPGMLVPFGSRIVVEGSFPHARFFDLQITPPLDGRSYRYDGGIGVGEVPLVDADIDPVPGSANPFRVGADRDAGNRGYRVNFEMSTGNPVALNAAFRPPYFRAPGNTRFGSGLQFQGPWGAIKGMGHGRGIWGAGELWVRYYLPDQGRGALAGVPLPKVSYQLADGRSYFIKVDTGAFFERANLSYRLDPESPVDPASQPETLGARAQWTKQTGIFRALLSGIAQNTHWGSGAYVRLLDQGVAGRGAHLSPPNNYEQSATSATYVNYLGRGMALMPGHVAALSGRLPTFPATHAGQRQMQAAEMRYWSIVGYEVPQGWNFVQTLLGPDSRPGGLPVHEVYDEQLFLNQDRWYLIVLSRPEDRPINAQIANGVTWQNWGPAAAVAWTLRWLTVGPEWTGPMAPTPEKLGRRVDWAEDVYDPHLLGNDHRGALGDYLPEVHYLSREEFEAMGPKPDASRLPHWQ